MQPKFPQNRNLQHVFGLRTSSDRRGPEAALDPFQDNRGKATCAVLCARHCGSLPVASSLPHVSSRRCKAPLCTTNQAPLCAAKLALQGAAPQGRRRSELC